MILDNNIKGRLMPLAPAPSPSSSEQVRIHCQSCLVVESYGLAQRLGWTADPESYPFFSYYCEVCSHG